IGIDFAALSCSSIRETIAEATRVEASLWTRCMGALETELPEQQFNTWVRPLQAMEGNGALKLLAPNRFVVDWINANLLPRIGELLRDESTGDVPIVTVEVGKTHLMHAIAHHTRRQNGEARIAYVHSERFVGDMVRALQHNSMNEFKTAYRSLDALLIDDIQFFAGKERSQEEFFHTFNELLEGQHQVILTCDRYPKEVEGLEERLKSRFGWGLTVA